MPDSPPPPPLRRAARPALLTLLVCLVIYLQQRLWLDSAWAWPPFVDDSYYYFQIARNVVDGQGWSMDQLTSTNGFQPLWMFLMVALAWMVRDPDALLITVQGASVLGFAATMGITWRVVARWAGEVAAWSAAGAMLAPQVLNLGLAGMEAALVLPIVPLLFDEISQSRSIHTVQPRRRDARTGLWLALLMLARLDSVFLLLVIAGYMSVIGLTRGEESLPGRTWRTFTKGLAVFWPVLALVLPYLAWNEVTWGHMVPISGVLKSTFPHPQLITRYLQPPYLAVLALGLFGGALSWRSTGSVAARTVTVLALGCLAHLVDTALFMKWAVFNWHFIAYVPVGLLGGALLVEQLQRQQPALTRFLPVLVALGALAAQVVSLQRTPSIMRWGTIEAGQWVDANLPADAVLGMRDSGVFSYFSRRRVMNLDGLVNEFAYMDALCQGDMLSFLREHGVQYIAQEAVAEETELDTYRTYPQDYLCQYDRSNDAILELRAEDEVWRGTIERPTYKGTHKRVTIWKLPVE